MKVQALKDEMSVQLEGEKPGGEKRKEGEKDSSKVQRERKTLRLNGSQKVQETPDVRLKHTHAVP